MDLGSLELQIFVSLTVVLGGAFVALVCDYLKGNNEQLREHNIELRVRKEEQERRMLLDPAGFLGQLPPANNAASSTAVPVASQDSGRTVAAHEVMQSFAAPEALIEVESRAARLQARGGNESFEPVDAPPLTQRRNGRIRLVRKGNRENRKNGEPYGDWVRPEVIARIARTAQTVPAAASGTEPLAAAERLDIALPVATAEPGTKSDEAELLQTEIERVSQLELQRLAPAPGTILRPLTVPSLKLEEEIQRVAERPAVDAPVPAVWHSPLLDEVIAASAVRSKSIVETELIESVAGTPVLEPALGVDSSSGPPVMAVQALELTPMAFQGDVIEAAEPPPYYFVAADELVESVGAEVPAFWPESADVSIEIEPAEPAAAGLLGHFAFGPHASSLAGMGVSPVVDYLPTFPPVEKPAASLALFKEPVLAFPEPSRQLDGSEESLPDLLPLYSDVSWEPAAGGAELSVVISAPPPYWENTSAAMVLSSPIDISEARTSEPTFPPAPVVTTPDLLLPTGMHDLATWTRLLSLPNPMTGILFVISLQPSEGITVPEGKGTPPPSDNGPAIEKLMTSFVREGDFGTRIAENEWVFIYTHDVIGFNQRRVGMIAEKLWDFQLRHLGMDNVNFKWGAVDVKSESLGEAVQAARDRMNQTRRSRKLPGADQTSTRRVVNA
jgi:hypothetical protein